MTEIVVATRDGVLRAPDGEQFRLVRGKTLADARHPAVRAYPDNFMPMEVEISVDDPEEAAPDHLEDDVAVELAELRETVEQAQAEAAEYKAQLTAIVEVLGPAGLIPPSTDTDKPGWVAAIVRGLVSRETLAPADLTDVPPPRSRKPRAAAASG